MCNSLFRTVAISLSLLGAGCTLDSDGFEPLEKAEGIPVYVLYLDTESLETGVVQGMFNNETQTVFVDGKEIALDSSSLLSRSSANNPLSFTSGLDTTLHYELTAYPGEFPTELQNSEIVFEGGAFINIVNSNQTFVGEMQSSVYVDLSDPDYGVAIELLHFEPNTGQNGSQPLRAVTGEEQVRISGLKLNGSTFSSTRYSLAEFEGFGETEILSDIDSIRLTGVFSGPEATEVAGVSSITSENGVALLAFSGSRD